MLGTGGNIMGNVYGYVRVSSIDQNEDSQLIVLDENKEYIDNSKRRSMPARHRPSFNYVLLLHLEKQRPLLDLRVQSLKRLLYCRKHQEKNCRPY